MKLYEEYITKEGRASNYPLGFHHICYHLSGEQELKEIDDYLKKNQLGFKLTFLEKSGSQECEHIIFYKIKNHGIVEFNIDGINL